MRVFACSCFFIKMPLTTRPVFHRGLIVHNRIDRYRPRGHAVGHVFLFSERSLPRAACETSSYAPVMIIQMRCAPFESRENPRRVRGRTRERHTYHLTTLPPRLYFYVAYGSITCTKNEGNPLRIALRIE